MTEVAGTVSAAIRRGPGLVTSGRQGLEIANPIYREIVSRVLTEVME